MSDLFLVAMRAVVCVENACVLIIINTTLAPGVLTATDTASES